MRSERQLFDMREVESESDLIEEPQTLAANIGHAKAYSSHSVGAFDGGDYSVSVGRGDKEDGSEQASVEEHLFIE